MRTTSGAPLAKLNDAPQWSECLETRKSLGAHGAAVSVHASALENLDRQASGRLGTLGHMVLGGEALRAHATLLREQTVCPCLPS